MTLAYTIGTLVTSREQHDAMRRSFQARGFAEPDCEFLTIDNTGTCQTSAYRGLNELLARALGRHVVLCHQDVRLIADSRHELDRCLADLEARDPSWAVAGNAGAEAPGRLAMRITDPHGADRRLGRLPARVQSLDENFLVVKRSARVGFSNDLDGFHFYGADICLVAATLGYTSYVVDFHLAHLSPGRKGADFHAAERAFQRKWSRALRPRWLQTTCALVSLGGGPVGRAVGRAASRPLAGIVRRLPSSRGWTAGNRA